jgi:hypothetical protein
MAKIVKKATKRARWTKGDYRTRSAHCANRQISLALASAISGSKHLI